jgi:hypothetical protein
MKTAVVLALSMLMNANAVPAKAAFKGCYERVYDKRYLKKHRKQEIIKIRLQLGVGKGTEGAFELLDRVDAGFRKRPIYQGNLIECNPSGNELKCAIEADGGTFIVTDRGNNSARITNKSYMNFGDDESDKFVIKGKGDNREFRLFRISETACP